MKLNLSKTNMIQKIERMQTILSDTEDESKKAKAQEELLIKQLNEIFECESLEEGKELLNDLISEKDEIDNDLEVKTDDLWIKMKSDGLI
jgi:hypothetical protein